MKSADLLIRWDDLLNPIVVKELRQAVKSRVVMVALLLFLFLQLGLLLIILFANEKSHAVNLHVGREVFPILQGILLGTCMLLIPAYVGVRLAAERSDTNVDLLFISTLRPRAILAGKFQAAVVLILLIFSACAPFMTFTYLLRGIDIPTILIVLALDFLVVLLGTQFALFLGAIPTSWGLKVGLGLIGLIPLGTLFGYGLQFSMALLDSGMGFRLDSVEFWWIAIAVATAAVAAIGLLFTWSVAIVSPPSANRALPVRVYGLAAWLVTGGVAVLLTRRFLSPIPLYMWMSAVTLLLCMQIVTSINERDHWGTRVARTIPRRWWLRGPAFLLYSGAAGGLLYAIVLLALSIGLPSYAVAQWSDVSSLVDRYVSNIGGRNALIMTAIALYTFDFSMTAVFLRNVLLPRFIKPMYTWLLALLLWGLGISLPYIMLFLFNNEDLRTGQVDPWSQITNPLSTIFTIAIEWRTDGGADFRNGALWFLSIWAAAMTLLCLPWLGRQVSRFHPPGRATKTD